MNSRVRLFRCGWLTALEIGRRSQGH
jgi:hypothetical protein